MSTNDVAKALYERAWARCGSTVFHKIELHVLTPNEALFKTNRYIATARWPKIIDGSIVEWHCDQLIPHNFDIWDIGKWVNVVKEMQSRDH